jgi:hypothetical protein
MSLPPKNLKLVLHMRKATPRDRTNFVAKGRFQFMTEAFIRENYIQFTPFQSSHLRGILPKGIFWIQIMKGGLIQWNWTLLQDYLCNEKIDQSLVDEFLDTLPKVK